MMQEQVDAPTWQEIVRKADGAGPVLTILESPGGPIVRLPIDNVEYAERLAQAGFRFRWPNR